MQSFRFSVGDSSDKKKLAIMAEPGEENLHLPTVSMSVEQGQISFCETFPVECAGVKNDCGELKKERKKTKSFTIKQRVTLLMVAAAEFMSYCSMSILAPFFPKEAASRGMTETMAGFLFGYYALVVFVTSPIFGKILPKLGVKFSFVSGLLLSGICSALFGALDTIQDNHLFTSLAFLIRGFQALGASAYSTAAYVLIITIFPDNAGAVRGIIETFVGLGMSAGPGVGGLLFAVGGFGLPFYVVGALIILLVPLNILFLPKGRKIELGAKSGSLRGLLRLSPVVATCCIIVVVAMTWGFLDPTLEPYLRKFNLSPKNVGLIFLLFSTTYGFFCPAWGWLSDKIQNYWWLMTAGLFCNSFILLFLGPSPIFYFIKDSIWLNVAALSLLGIFVAMALMPTYQFIVDSALESGFGDNIGTHAAIAGLWSSVYSLGEVLGPILGGALYEKYDFPVTATTFSALNFLLAVVATAYFVWRKHQLKGASATDILPVISDELKYGNAVSESAVEQYVRNGIRRESLKTK